MLDTMLYNTFSPDFLWLVWLFLDLDHGTNRLLLEVHDAWIRSGRPTSGQTRMLELPDICPRTVQVHVQYGQYPI